MEDNVLTQFTFNYKEVVIDEIALEGLEGIALDLLWRRLEKRFSLTLSQRTKSRLWNFVVNCKEISFYKLDEPRARLEIVDRFTIVDELSGHLKDPDEYIDGPYVYSPVTNEYGSCQNYHRRELLEKSENCLLETVVSEYGDCFILVASLAERWRALAPQASFELLETLPPIHYCLLELIGKSRENGQMSIGKSNLTKFFKDPKLLFYNKKPLQEMNLIATNSYTLRSGSKGNKAILIRLKRFHKSQFASQPKIGKQHELAEYLKKKPNFCESLEVLMKDNLVTSKQVKMMKKSTNIIFNFEELPPNEDQPERRPKAPRHYNRARKQVKMVVESEESAESDEEASGEPERKCEYKVGVSLLRQAYERFLDAGLKGLTNVQLSQVLGVDFYTSRTICRLFMKKNIVREILEDRGRQRMAKFIAVAATGVADENYAQEKQQLIDYLSKPNPVADRSELAKHSPVPIPSTSNNIEEVPRKRIKLENSESISNIEETDGITELTAIEGLENVEGYMTTLKTKTKGPTMRQLKFANGLIKVIRQKESIAGYQTLSNLVAKEINEPPMDTKAVKTFLQKLVADGQLKIYTLKWPGKNRCTNLICAPHVKKDDPIVKDKYKEICMRALISTNRGYQGSSAGGATHVPPKPLFMFAYPRYTKVRKFHEFLMKMVLFSGGVVGSGLPPGFASLIQVIPVMPLELAIGHLSPLAMTNLTHLKLTDEMLKKKLQDVPVHVYTVLLQSRSFQTCLRENLKILASFGLIQLCHRTAPTIDWHSGLLQYVFYLNRNAKIIDTRGDWPRTDAVLSSLEKSFRFDTYDDVLTYWEALHNISTSTRIVAQHSKTRQYPSVSLRKQDEVMQFDDGRVYGDGRGAAGLDSIFYLELQTNWETISFVNLKPVMVKTIKVPRTARTLKAKAPSQPRQRKPRPRSEGKKRIPKKAVIPHVGKRTRKNLRLAKWEPWEDEIIMLCKAGMTIMSPSSQPGCLSVRNMVAKDILMINDRNKIPNVCHRRAAIVDSNSTLVHMSECLINEVKRRRPILMKYEGLLKKLRQQNQVNMNKYINAARVPLMELVMILYKIARSVTFNKVTPCVAVNLEEFHRDFSITTETSHRPLNLYRTPAEFDTVISTTKEVLVMALALKIKGELHEATSLGIYHVLKTYPERTVRVALEHLRKTSMLAASEKVFHNILNRFTFKDVVQTASTYKATVARYRLSASYMRHITCKFDIGFGEDLARACDGSLPNPLFASAATNCVILERKAQGLIDIVTLVPPCTAGAPTFLQVNKRSANTADAIEGINPSLKLKTGLVGWKMVAEQSSLEEPLIVYEEFLQSIVRDATILPPNKDYPKNDKVIEVLKDKMDNGASFMELRDLSGLDATTLKANLSRLASERMIKRVGFYENVIVLTEYAEPWSVPLGDKRLIPTPWLTLDWAINMPVFIKWCSVVLNTIFNNPGMSVLGMATGCEVITARAVQEICVFLEKCQCVKLEVIRQTEPDLFSSDEGIESDEYNEFESPNCIFALPVKDTMCRFAKLRKCMLADLATS